MTAARSILLLAALILIAPPALAEDAPKIGEIFITMAEPENPAAAALLSERDGKTVTLGTINADIATDEHYRIAETCFPTKSAEDPAFGGDIKGKALPLPIEGKPDCSVMFRIEAADDSPYETTGGGTGIVRIPVDETFTVTKQMKDGVTTFVLTPVE
ncbi:hypothetical protein [Methyloligella solikamskensis]|uniref:Uncharacterized protein n=1 Tax=Methyloligella solikamskensis TaxID=1177756 RepID=A0ABW3J905_9HYPH